MTASGRGCEAVFANEKQAHAMNPNRIDQTVRFAMADRHSSPGIRPSVWLVEDSPLHAAVTRDALVAIDVEVFA
ncbi:MAG: hypothetical protein ABI175_18875, partial [Polyangiales bacterium]